MKSIRRVALPLLYEVLKYPLVLKNSSLCDVFVKFLEEIQRTSPLKLSDQILPGLLNT